VMTASCMATRERIRWGLAQTGVIKGRVYQRASGGF
jgi:hypothetical protein